MWFDKFWTNLPQTVQQYGCLGELKVSDASTSMPTCSQALVACTLLPITTSKSLFATVFNRTIRFLCPPTTHKTFTDSTAIFSWLSLKLTFCCVSEGVPFVYVSSKFGISTCTFLSSQSSGGINIKDSSGMLLLSAKSILEDNAFSVQMFSVWTALFAVKTVLLSVRIRLFSVGTGLFAVRICLFSVGTGLFAVRIWLFSVRTGLLAVRIGLLPG